MLRITVVAVTLLTLLVKKILRGSHGAKTSMNATCSMAVAA